MFSVLFGLVTIIAFGLIYYWEFDFIIQTDQKILTSFVAGFGVVYVIIYMLPQLAHGQHLLKIEFGNRPLLGNSSFVYIVTLLGTVFFYLFDWILGLDKDFLKNNIQTQEEQYDYWMHIVFFALYNLLIGATVGLNSLTTFFQQFIYLIAYAIHFLAIRWGIRQLNPKKYNTINRYIFIGLLVLGYLLTALFNLPEYIVGIFEAFIVGGMMLLVFKHEIPKYSKSNNTMFFVGIILATMLFVWIT